MVIWGREWGDKCRGLPGREGIGRDREIHTHSGRHRGWRKVLSGNRDGRRRWMGYW